MFVGKLSSRFFPRTNSSFSGRIERRFSSFVQQLPSIDFEEYRNKCKDGRFDEPISLNALEKIKVIEEEHRVIERNLDDPSQEKKVFLKSRIERIVSLCTQNFLPTTKTRQTDELKVLLSSIPDHYQSLRLALTEEERSKAANRNRFLNEYGKKKSQLLSNEQKEYENSAAFQAFLEKIGQEFRESPFETIYFAYAWPTDARYETESWVQPFLKHLQAHLRKAGFPIVQLDIVSNRYGANINTFMRGANESRFVLLFGTESLLDKFSTGTSAVCAELIHILRKREEDGKRDLTRVFPILLSGEHRTAFPPEYERFSTIRDWRDGSYLHNIQHLFLELLGLPPESHGVLLQEYWAKVSEEHQDTLDAQFYEEQRRKLDACRRNYNLQELQEIPISVPIATNFNIWDLHPHFVGRKEIFKAIADHFQNNMVCLLFGLSGMGKTQIAFHFAKQAGYSQIWMINGRNEAARTNSYKEIAKKLNLYIEEEVFLEERVHGELEKKSGKPWLLIYDNATNREELQILPQRGGNILVTTTMSTLWSKKDQIEIDSLYPDEAINLLEAVTGEPPSTAMEDLAKSLGYFPLALSLAASCIADTTTIETFYASYDPVETSLSKDLFYEHTIQTVWKKTLETIEREEPLALAWLEICAYLDPSHLPNTWIGEWLEEVEGNQRKALVIPQLLTSLAVFKKRGDEEFSLHPLLQKVIRNNASKGKELAISLIRKQMSRFNENDGTTWNYGRQVALHTYWLLEENLFSSQDQDQHGELITESGYISLVLNDLRKAEKLNQVALEVAASKYPNEPSDTIRPLNNLGWLSQIKGDLDQALQLYTHALEICKRLYQDPPHPDTIRVLNNLGLLWQDKRDLDLALKFHELALKMGRSLYKDSPHSSITMCLHNLGRLWYKMGDQDQALQYLSEALEIDKKISGNTPGPLTAVVLNNLGVLWDKMGDQDQALQLLAQSLEVCKKLYNNSPHQDTSGSFQNLGLIWYEKGDLDQAFQFLSRALEMRKKLYSDSPHPDTISTLQNLVWVWHDMGDLDQAILLHTQALDMRKKLYGKISYSEVARSLHDLGRLWKLKGDLEQALQFYTQSLEMLKKLHKDSPHPDIGMVLFNLGGLWHDKGDLDHALQLYSQALEIFKRVYKDSPHSDTAGILNDLGYLWQDKGNLDLARTYMQQSYEMMRQVHGENHPQTRKVKNNLDNLQR